MFQITCQSGPLRGKRFEIKGSTTVGRESFCNIMLEDPKVSRHHGTFVIRNGELHYIDNKSTNGSFLNGAQITEADIALGDVLKLGGNEFAIFEEGEFRTISFVGSETSLGSDITMLPTKGGGTDALADKLASMFDYYKDYKPEENEAERYEIVRTQRLLTGLKNIYALSQAMTRVVPLAELLTQIGRNVFEVFAGAENLVIMLDGEDGKGLVPRHAVNRDPKISPTMNISTTVLDKAVRERVTLIANNASTDQRLSSSDSIIGFAVKSVMCSPLVSGDKVIGALYLDNRSYGVNYDELDGELVTAFANQCAVAIENAKLCDTLQKHYHQTLQALVNAIEAKDAYTMGHTARVSKYSVGIGRVLGFEAKRLERLKMAADLHDIGKIGVKEGIINKAGKLTETEYHSVKHHVEMGEKILSPINYLQDLLPFIRSHHEKWDGTGYPDGLKGEQCPLEGRVLALADAFDAMTSQRSYNKPMTFQEAAAKIQEVSGKHFDPFVVKAFRRYVDEVLVKEAAPPQPVSTQRNLVPVPAGDVPNTPSALISPFSGGPTISG